MTTATSLAERPSTPSRLLHAARDVRAEAAVAILAFLGLCVAVLLRAPQMLEPDDYAYRASIVALSQFHILLSGAQYTALEKTLGSSGGIGGGAIQQWHQATTGLWISEKNPGYPFLAVPFQWLGISRITPLFYGAVGCIGLWFGARRWLGHWGGTFAVVLFCSSGAALAFAWRATMETFTDASLVAAGAGALLWTLLATDATQRRRRVVGIAGLIAVALATWARYTDGIAVLVAVAAIAIFARRTGINWRTLAAWGTTVILAIAGMLAFNQYAYGGWNRTGYSGGEITFSLGAFSPNLQHMPGHLVRAMPMLLLGLVALGWIAVRGITAGRTRGAERRARRRDLAVAAVLGVAWLAFWVLYLCYDWTAQMSASSSGSIHVIRFYLPALGLIALLASWPLVRIVRIGARAGAITAAVMLAALVLAGGWSYQQLVTTAAGPGGGGPGGARSGQSFGGPGGARPTGAPPSGSTGGFGGSGASGPTGGPPSGGTGAFGGSGPTGGPPSGGTGPTGATGAAPSGATGATG